MEFELIGTDEFGEDTQFHGKHSEYLDAFSDLVNVVTNARDNKLEIVDNEHGFTVWFQRWLPDAFGGSVKVTHHGITYHIVEHSQISA